MNQKKLWEILVPTLAPDGTPFLREHHQEWDAKVLAITGGLTIRSTVNGLWIDIENNHAVRERMIPVRIMCTEEEIVKISDFTAKHYEQKAIMLYKISDCVYIREYT